MSGFLLIISVFLLLSNLYAAYDSHKDGSIALMYLCFLGTGASFNLVVTYIIRMTQGGV